MNTYVGRIRADGTRAEPIFPVQVWSVFQRTLDREDRTNNFAEACHKKLQMAFGVAHPSLWNFLNKLKKILKTVDIDYERFVTGHAPPRKRPIYEQADRRILQKVRTYNRANIVEFLRGLSHNYQME